MKIITSLSFAFIFLTSCYVFNSEEGFDEKTTALITKGEIIVRDVDAVEFKDLIDHKEGQILDVRTPEEWATGIIEGAIMINYYDRDFKQQLTRLAKDKPVFVYCKAGVRGGNALKKMVKIGFVEVYNLEGGITAWQKANYPITKQN